MNSEDIEKLITKLAETRGEDGFTTDEAIVLIRFASQAEADFAMLNLIRQGKVDVDVEDNEIVIKRKKA